QNFSKNSLFKMSSMKRISTWGIYTYGLYCIHVIAIIFVEIAFKKAGFDMQSPFILLLLSVVAFVLCMFIAFISYHYFEKRFLRLKDRFAFIVKK
ncbi:MAG: acyltransferase, partial [Bacteroidota bacterium]|nr:acyltransferase [Bacteroidota bacterium]